MTALSLGAYLCGCRLSKQLTQVQLAQAASLQLGHRYTASVIWKIEQGKIAPPGDLLLVLIRLLDADIEMMTRLLLDPEATINDGLRAAELVYVIA